MILDLEGGKYTIVFNDAGFRALRYGEPWRDLTGDGLMLIMASEIEKLRADNLELEGLCNATYVALGADAYNHACEVMEGWQEDRARKGKKVGTTGSLCDGISWLYGYIDELEETLSDFVEGGI